MSKQPLILVACENGFRQQKRNLFFLIYRGWFSFRFLCAGSVFGLLRGRAPRAAFPPLSSSLAARSGGRGPLPARAPSAAGGVCLGSITFRLPRSGLVRRVPYLFPPLPSPALGFLCCYVSVI